MNKDGRSPADAGSGSQASPAAPSGSAPTVSIPNAVKIGRVRVAKMGRKATLSRYRSVSLFPARSKRGKAWAVILKNRGMETRFGISDEAMLSLFKLYMRSRAEPKRTAIIRAEYEWREMTPEEIAASGIEAATADETALAGSAVGESPAAESRDVQGQSV